MTHRGDEQNERAARELEQMGRGFAEDAARKRAEHERAVRERHEREGRPYETQLERLDRIERERGGRR